MVIPAIRDLVLQVVAPGYVEQTRSVFWVSQMVVHLQKPEEVAVQSVLPGTGTARVVAPPVARRAVSVVVEGLEGERLKDAEVVVIDAATSRVHEKKLLLEGVGSLEVEAKSGTSFQIVATAPGRERGTATIGKSDSYVVKLKLRKATAQPPPARRAVSVVVEGLEGERLKDAEVVVIDAATSRVHEKKLLLEGVGSLEVEAKSGTSFQIVATAPGRERGTATIGKSDSYVVKLKPRKAAVQPPPARRAVSVVVEGLEGERLKDAEVVVIDAATSRVHEKKLLLEGVGSLKVEAKPGASLQIVATAPGRERGTAPIGKSESYVVKLKPRLASTQLSVEALDAIGRKVAQATLVVSERGRELARATTDKEGLAGLEFTYSDPTGVVLEAYHGGYQTRRVHLRLPKDKNVRVSLMPSRPKAKSNLVTVLVLSKVFTASPKTFARVRATVHKLLSECSESPDVWAGVGLYTLGDGRVREVLPLKRRVDSEALTRAKRTLSGLYGSAGPLNWRDLKALGEFLTKPGRVGPSGCDVLVLTPKNMSLDEEMSLYDAGGEPVLNEYRAKDLRLRLVEIGAIEDVTKSYEEFCEGSRGYYRALINKDSLSDEVVKLQFHLPNPPPVNLKTRE